MARKRKLANEKNVHYSVSIAPQHVKNYEFLVNKFNSGGKAWEYLIKYHEKNEESALNTYPLAQEVINKIGLIAYEKLGMHNEIQAELIPTLGRLLTSWGHAEEVERREAKRKAQEVKPLESIVRE